MLSKALFEFKFINSTSLLSLFCKTLFLSDTNVIEKNFLSRLAINLPRELSAPPSDEYG